MFSFTGKSKLIVTLAVFVIAGVAIYSNPDKAIEVLAWLNALLAAAAAPFRSWGA